MLAFASIPLFMMLSMSQRLGVMSLQCDRPEPESVSCQRQKTAYFGLVQPPAQAHHHVTGAELNTTTQGTDAKGRPTDEYWVTIQTDQGEVLLLEAPMEVNGIKGNKRKMAALAQQINDFIQSDQPTLTLQRDNRTAPRQFGVVGHF